MTLPAARRRRLAIVGCGAVTRMCHLPALVGLEAFELVALVDRVRHHADEAAELYHRLCIENDCSPKVLPQTADDLEQVFHDIDSAIVATAPHTHAAITTALLRAHKAVLVEKPLAHTVAQCMEIRAAADTNGAVVVPAHVRRLFPAARWVKQILNEGRLGTIDHVRWSEGMVYNWPSITPSTFQSAAEGGGLFFDLGPHVLDMLSYWFGRPDKIIDFADNSYGGADSEVEIQLGFGRLRVDVELSRLRTLTNDIVLKGSHGTIRVGVARAADYVEYNAAGEPTRSASVPVVSPAQWDRKGLFRQQLVEFGKVVSGHEGNLATIDDGIAAVELIEQCRAVRTARLPQPWRNTRSATLSCTASKIAVTGATGFIGSNVTELLLRGTGDSVIVAVTRSPQRLTRLSHLDRTRLRHALADIRDVPALTAAFQGCDVVIHTTYGSEGTDLERWSVTVDGTAVVLAAAEDAGVKRIVHISTMAVYDTTGTKVLHEGTARRAVIPGDLSYSQQKLAAERLVMQELGSETQIVCVQPGVVYGPWGPVWTMRPLQNLRTMNGQLPSGPGGGVCNAIHVHDVADAVVFLASATGVSGLRVLLSGPTPVSWGTFYDHYRDLLGVDRHGRCDSSEWPEKVRELYNSPAVINTQRLTSLGFVPRIDIHEGMAQIASWASWASLI